VKSPYNQTLVASIVSNIFHHSILASDYLLYEYSQTSISKQYNLHVTNRYILYNTIRRKQKHQLDKQKYPLIEKINEVIKKKDHDLHSYCFIVLRSRFIVLRFRLILVKLFERIYENNFMMRL
jgi:hypothetical protein